MTTEFAMEAGPMVVAGVGVEFATRGATVNALTAHFYHHFASCYCEIAMEPGILQNFMFIAMSGSDLSDRGLLRDLKCQQKGEEDL